MRPFLAKRVLAVSYGVSYMWDVNVFLLLTYQFENKKSVLVFGMIIYGKIERLMKGRPCGDSSLKRHRHFSDC